VAEAPPTETGEQMAEQVELILKEIAFTVSKDKVTISIRGTTGDLTYKEWRVVRTFVDNIFSEMRAAR